MSRKILTRPSYSELVILNPRLGRKSSTEIDALVTVIEECGYSWEPSRQQFYNAEIGRGLRTQGLDLFAPEKFKEDHDARIARIQNDPQAYAKYARGMGLWQTHSGKFLKAFVLMLLGGWIFLPFTYWLLVLVLIAVSFWIFRIFTFRMFLNSGYSEFDDIARNLETKEQSIEDKLPG